jgi:hypothetical protein
LDQIAIPPAELDRLLAHAGPAILVGGQALAFWIALYSVPIDDAPAAVVTKDADFLGRREDAIRLSAAVGGSLEFPKGMTILAGIVRKQVGPNEQYEVDILRTLNGLSPSEVAKHAKEITDRVTGARYLVMSPVDCLISRLENLRTILEKQNEPGVWQARVAVRVARRHMEDLLARDEEKAAIRAATDILDASTQPMGLNAFKKYEIDALESIPVERYRTKAFREQQWPRAVKRIRGLRVLTGGERRK